ncbi:MAG: alpha-amylase family glycosyl hydrolase [Bacteroidales bacterium]|jgi:1,4-alpha-glucan branching enzyme|nr:alpha-amylase family glycosyl hydrolase [Bacteroidales bacterium]
MKKITYLLFALLLFTSCTARKDADYVSLHPEWCYNSTIYEMNIRQFTPEGTFEAAGKQLDRLKDLGTDILWLMPIYPIGEKGRKGDLGSYYSISDYKSVNPEFGTMEDFGKFLCAAHQKGFKVLLDMVSNHTSLDAEWWKQGHKNWYVLDSAGHQTHEYDWSDIASLNFNNREMRRAMIDVYKFWLDKGVDGFRCDAAGEVPLDFWKEAVPEIKRYGKSILMIAEAEGPQFHKAGFDITYSWKLYHLMNDMAAGKSNADLLRKYLKNEFKYYGCNDIKMNFTSNHDENSNLGPAPVRLGDAVEEMAALTYVLPGIPLVYNGQEVGSYKKLRFFYKDTIDWNSAGASRFTMFYRNFDNLKINISALDCGLRGAPLVELDNDDKGDVFSFSRKNKTSSVVCIFNLSSDTTKVVVDLGLLKGEYRDVNGIDSVELGEKYGLLLHPWEYKVYYKGSSNR